MKILNNFFEQKSNATSISAFAKYAMDHNSMNQVRGGGDPSNFPYYEYTVPDEEEEGPDQG